MATQTVAFPDDHQGAGNLDLVRQSSHAIAERLQPRAKLRTCTLPSEHPDNELNDSQRIVRICAAMNVVLEYPIASLKSRLIRLLADSLVDEGRGLVDVARERQIQKLMKQLKEESLYDPHGPHANDDTDDARRARADSSARTDGQKAPNYQTEMQRTAIR